ncbi:MAG: hypothetical protein J7L47_07285 [Candidatus Odinarchaeota archaeon]|nr:hypothetical protein [Candidatus Odinarchaeota archaeon]
MSSEKVVFKALFSLPFDDLKKMAREFSIEIEKDDTRLRLIHKIKKSILEGKIKQEAFAYLFFEKLSQIYDSMFNFLNNLSKKDLIALLKEVSGVVISSKEAKSKKKEDIIDDILSYVALQDILKTNTIMNLLKEKRLKVVKKEIKKAKEIKELKDIKLKMSILESMVKDLPNKVEVTFSNIVKQYLREIERIDDMELLRALYDYVFRSKEKLTLEDISNLKEILIEKFNLKNDIILTLKLVKAKAIIEALLNMKSIKWHVPDEVFFEVFKEAFDEVKAFPDAAEIYKVRNIVCKRLNISKEEFDEALLRFWRNGKVILEHGAPIESKNVEFLELPDGTKYYYVKLVSRW